MRVVEAGMLGDKKLSTARKYALYIAKAVEAEIRQCQGRKAACQQEIGTLRSQIAELEKQRDVFSKIPFLGILAVFSFVHLGFLLFLLAGLAYFQATALSKKIADYTNRIQKLFERTASQVPRRVVNRIGQIYYPLTVRPTSGGTMYLDGTGRVPGVTFTFPQIPGSAEEVKEMAGNVTRLSSLPILLDGNGPAPFSNDGAFRPVGEEATLVDTIDRLRYFLDQQSDLTTVLPVLPASDNLVQSLLHLSWGEERPAPPTLLSVRQSQDVADALQAVEAIAAEASAARELGDENIENVLMQTANRIEEILLEYSQAREHSFSDILLPSLTTVSGPYDLPLTRRYCPKCHDLPAWNFMRLGFTPSEAASVPVDHLLRLPNPAPAIELRHQIDDLRSQFASVRDDDPEAPTRRRSYQTAIRRRTLSLSAEIRQQVAKRFVANAPRSRNAVLRLSLRDNLWHCPVCAEAFPEEEARLMSLLKIEDDLMFPMWRHLWLEKHDERNSILRDKEAERRRNKESEMSEYREEARQFSEEVRPLRIKIDDAASSMQGASGKIMALVEQFSALGLLDDVDASRYRAFVEEGGGTPEFVLQLKNRVVSDEKHLESEPERVHDLRPTEIDIVDTYTHLWAGDGSVSLTETPETPALSGGPQP